jgi:hypothetical protein
LEFDGSYSTHINKDGALVLIVGDSEVVLQAPVTYQTIDGKRVAVDSRYLLKSDNRVAFAVSAYDKDKELVIDPVLSYSTYLGGNDSDIGNGIAVDSSGNAYVTGYTASTDFPTQGAIQGAHAGGTDDAFVTKVNSAGSAGTYSTYLGGDYFDKGFGIAVDSSGSAYVTGYTSSTDFPTVNPVQTNADTDNNTNLDAFVTKLGPDASSSSGTHTLVVYETGADPAGMGYIYSEPAGISCPGTCSAGFDDGVEVTLFARNVNGMEFLRYEGDCADVPRSEPCVLTMNSYKEVPVRFYPPEPRLTMLMLDPMTGLGEPDDFSETMIELSSGVQQGSCETSTIIIHNHSNRALDIGLMGGLDPLSSPFSFAEDNCSDTTLPFHSDCTMKIEYCPTNAGPHTDTFDCPTSDPNFPSQTVEVTGGS